MNLVTDLHCGACMTSFDDISVLNEHLKTCSAAKALLLPIVNIFLLHNDGIGHPTAHLIFACHRNAHLIRRYAYAVADDVDTLIRAKLHCELCDKLGLPYNKFRPFESENIATQPSRIEAEEILWNAIGMELRSIELGSPK